MKSVFRTLLNVLLLVSLATMPVAGAFAAVQTGDYLSAANGEGMMPCPHALQDKSPVSGQNAVSAKTACTCHVDDCSAMGNGSCQHSTVSSLAVLLPATLKFPVLASNPVRAIVQGRHTGLSVPPESPPPIL